MNFENYKMLVVFLSAHCNPRTSELVGKLYMHNGGKKHTTKVLCIQILSKSRSTKITYSKDKTDLCL
jgi:hypothetical protein